MINMNYETFYSVQPLYYYVKLYNILYVQIKKDI